jgi:hypothetical protein
MLTFKYLLPPKAALLISISLWRMLGCEETNAKSITAHSTALSYCAVICTAAAAKTAAAVLMSQLAQHQRF